jgi:ATP/maltotriose-dependent transcriptional regulator MalT/DNA-binding SARP family transcriptional activator
MIRPAHSGTAFAKTTRPTIGSAVARESLFAGLDEPAGRTVVWISGPPGSGKTTLAAGYVQARKLQSAWYQVDSDDADAATFFHYLAHAMRRLDATRARDLPVFTPRRGSDVASFTRKFFRQLFASGKPLALVLDNLQATPEDSPLHLALEAGLAQVPKGSCVIVTSRNDPPASLARLRAAGLMSCVPGKELALGPDEIVAIARLRGQLVSPESAAKLYERTQGWAAGLVLLLEHSKFSGRIGELPSDAAPQVIFDYVGGEIFDRFERPTREFLLRVACLPRMTAAVAQALSGEAKAERLLINLAQNDYFVREGSSDGGRVYQLHPLLREFLRRRAEQTLPEAVDREALRRAGALLRSADQPEDAVALLIEAGDWDEIARIAADEGDAMLAEGRSETLARWLDLLPAGLREADPQLLRCSAAARADTSPRAARQLYERAFEGFCGRNDHAGMLKCCCGIVTAIVLEFDDLAPLDHWLEKIDQLLVENAPADADAITTLVRASLLRDPANPRVERWLHRSDESIPAVPDATARDAREALAPMRAFAAFARGDVASALAALAEWARSDGEDSAIVVAEGLLRVIEGAYDAASRVAQDGLSAADAEGSHAHDAWLLAIAVVSRLCIGDRAASDQLLRLIEEQGARLRRGDRACLHYLRAWRAAIDGDSADAHRDSKLALALSVETGIPWFECLARIEIAQTGAADRPSVEAQLRAAEEIAERLRSPWLKYSVRLAASAAALQAGERRAALEDLRIAFRAGHEHGFRQPPGWPSRALGELCALALESEVEPEFARALVREGRLTPATPPLGVRHWPWALRILSFGGFQCLRDGTPIELSAKGPGRPMELLKVLVALGMHNVRADQLADALWPNVEADYAYKSFTATLHRLRRMLGEEDAVVLRDGRLSLDKSLVWIDAWALEQLFDDFDAAMRGGDACADEELRRESVERALELYRGPFLPDEIEQPSYIAHREQIRSRLLRFLARIASGWEEAGAPKVAIDCYLRFIEADELCEALYRQMMRGCQRGGAAAESVAAYERLRTLLAARMKSMPSPETQALYARIKSGDPGGA